MEGLQYPAAFDSEFNGIFVFEKKSIKFMNWKERSTATTSVTFKDTLCNSSWHRNQAIETILRIPAKQDLAW